MSESQPTKETTVGETLRVTGKIKSAGWGDTSFVQIEVDQKLPLTIGVGQPVTLEITLPDPPMPRCPLCGVTEGEVLGNANPCGRLLCGPCDIAIVGPTKPTKAEAIAAFRQIVREPK